jgi:hypothetical protein
MYSLSLPQCVKPITVVACSITGFLARASSGVQKAAGLRVFRLYITRLTGHEVRCLSTILHGAMSVDIAQTIHE